MRRVVRADPHAVAESAAGHIASAASDSVASHGRFCVAFSGGSTPALLFDRLAELDLPWPATFVFQVDERVAPDGHPDRNAVELQRLLLSRVPIPADHVHLMPVATADPAAASTQAYTGTLQSRCGIPPVLDLVHLGLGDDGHTASLAPGFAVLDESAADVALTDRPFNGRFRMTLTFPALDRARRILWVVTGAEKRPALARMLARDPAIPAGRVEQSRAVLIADEAALPHS